MARPGINLGLVLLHPEDAETLGKLQSYFPKWATSMDHFPNGEPSLMAFYGER